MRYPPLPWPENVERRELMQPFWRDVLNQFVLGIYIGKKITGE